MQEKPIKIQDLKTFHTCGFLMGASAKTVLAVLTEKCFEGPLHSTEKQQAPPPEAC